MENPKRQVSLVEFEAVRGKVSQLEVSLVEVKSNTSEALSISKACKYILDIQEAREKLKQEMLLQRAKEEAEINDRVRERTSMLEIKDSRIDGNHKRRVAWVTVIVSVGTLLLGAISASFTSYLFRK